MKPDLPKDVRDHQKAEKAMNRDRAGWVEAALGAFCEETGQDLDVADQDSFNEVVGDFLGDLMHLCRLHGYCFGDLVNKGAYHFAIETAIETCTFNDDPATCMACREGG